MFNIACVKKNSAFLEDIHDKYNKFSRTIHLFIKSRYFKRKNDDSKEHPEKDNVK